MANLPCSKGQGGHAQVEKEYPRASGAAAFVEVVKRRMSLEFEETRIKPEMVLQALGYASVNGMTIEASCQALARTPSGNRLREVLPKREVLKGN